MHSDYLLDVRISRAEELIKHGDSPVADIAHAVGYANVSKFCEVFRRKFGMTPLKYRFKLEALRTRNLGKTGGLRAPVT